MNQVDLRLSAMQNIPEYMNEVFIRAVGGARQTLEYPTKFLSHHNVSLYEKIYYL
jgi:hypothetical protein